MNNSNFPVVAIAASSGALDSLARLLGRLDVNLPVAFLLYFQAHQDHYARLIARLQNETRLPLRIGESGQALDAGFFYLVPSGLQVEQHLHPRFHASPNPAGIASVDRFFSTLAEQIGSRTVGILLTGDASDGIDGMGRIFRAGGITIAQQPDTTSHEVLPPPIFGSGAIMYMMAPEEIAEWLPAMLAAFDDGDNPQVVPGRVGRLLNLLRERMNLDFPDGKLGAIQRCVRRRQQIQHCESAGDYCEWIQSHPLELEALARDVMASVSAFYRDPHAFAVLSGHLENLCRHKKPGDDIRIWVPACASGEEAYSIAMLLAETLSDLKNYRIQIFATDIDESALAVARRGIFSEKSIHGIPPLLRERYFVAKGKGFEVVKTLRDMIIFAHHDLDVDLPIMQLDLVSCRRALLYLESHHQWRLLQRFHFSLLPGGMLVVGSGLNPVDVESLFVGVDGTANIYLRASMSVDPPIDPEQPRTGFYPSSVPYEADDRARAPKGQTIHSAQNLRVANEVLAAVNEELRVANEELLSLNAEINRRSAAFAQLSEEYQHLYDSLEFPLLVFDRHQRLVRFNIAAKWRFHLRATSLQASLAQLGLGALEERIAALMKSVFAHQVRDELVFEQDHSFFRLSVTPGFSSMGDMTTLIVTCLDVTDISRANDRLAQSEAKLSTLMASTSVLFAMKDMQGRYIYANRRFLDFFGLMEDNLVGRTDFQVLPNALATAVWSHDCAALRGQKPVHTEHEHVLAGAVSSLRSTHQVLLGSANTPTAFLFEAEDVTPYRQAENQLRIAAKIFDRAGEAILVGDARGTIEAVNDEFCSMTGYTPIELRQQSVNCLKSDRHSTDFYQQIWKCLQENGFWQGEIWIRRKHGGVFSQWLTVSGICTEMGDVEHFVAVLADIDRIQDSRRRAEYLSTHDTLTGLPNRTLFQDRLRHALSRACRTSGTVALFFIDLDNFKSINDTLGHDIGDHLLKMAADRLRNLIRDVDTVARLGGDEFTAILSDCSPEMTAEVARRIVDDIATSFEIEHRTLFVSASIGVAIYPQHGDDATSLIKAADSAMYRAKALGRNRVAFFEPDLQVELYKRAAIESGIRDALKHRRFRLVFQPQHAIHDAATMTGAEVLMRWRDPMLGEVAPAEFIAVAEEGGLMADVGREMRRMLFAQIRAWREAGKSIPRLAMNVSPRCMQEAGFARCIIEELNANGVASECIVVEITESALLENTKNCTKNIDMLMEHGITLSIDDFGTGYSSLGYLKRLRLGELKIDKSFVEGLGSNVDDEAIARAVLALARALNIRTVAEGVQTIAQHDWLKAHGCETGQGYLYAHPLELADFENYLKAVGNGA